MLEGEFILDGYAFGTPEHDVIILSGGLDTGSASIRTQDADVRDYTLFGRDYLTGPTWAFTLGIDHDAADSVLFDLARVWRNPAVRNVPGQLSTLQFKRNGKEYRVYGRPRNFGVSPADVASTDWQMVAADFRTDSPYMFDNDPQTHTLALGEVAVDEGLILPETMPWLLGGETASGQAVINVQTLDPTPFEVYIRPGTAPLSQIPVEGPGWSIDINETVNPGSVLRIDTRRNTIDIDGASIAGSLARGSSLAARLWSGMSTVSFAGIDTSGTATAQFVWRGSYPII